jgi:hypothetical protein
VLGEDFFTLIEQADVVGCFVNVNAHINDVRVTVMRINFCHVSLLEKVKMGYLEINVSRWEADTIS